MLTMPQTQPLNFAGDMCLLLSGDPNIDGQRADIDGMSMSVRMTHDIGTSL